MIKITDWHDHVLVVWLQSKILVSNTYTIQPMMGMDMNM